MVIGKKRLMMSSWAFAAGGLTVSGIGTLSNTRMPVSVRSTRSTKVFRAAPASTPDSKRSQHAAAAEKERWKSIVRETDRLGGLIDSGPIARNLASRSRHGPLDLWCGQSPAASWRIHHPFDLGFPFSCELLSRHFHRPARGTQFDIESNQVDKISIVCRVASAGFPAMRPADLLD